MWNEVLAAFPTRGGWPYPRLFGALPVILLSCAPISQINPGGTLVVVAKKHSVDHAVQVFGNAFLDELDHEVDRLLALFCVEADFFHQAAFEVIHDIFCLLRWGTYREQGSNLHVQRTPDPKSGASTNSAIPAQGVKTRPQVLRTARLGDTMRQRERAARFKDAVFQQDPERTGGLPA